MAKLVKEQWDEILAKVKDGEKVSELAELYGVSSTSIYNRTAGAAGKDSSLLEINRLKREVKTLRELVGYITAEVSKEKKLV
jgi:hypothetical protein